MGKVENVLGMVPELLMKVVSRAYPNSHSLVDV